MKFWIPFLFVSACACAVAEPAGATPDVIVRNYCAAEQTDARSLAGSSMDVEIDASLPRLKKHGRLYALRRISSLGRITYERLRFEGDGTVKSQVIARYLTAEAQAQQTQNPALAVTPENYKFKYKGANELDGRTVYVFQVTPRKKQVGLFKGEVWIDSTTYLRLQESGRLVKSPSIFLKKVQFVRTYEIVDGISVPRQMQSVVDTRIVGKAELTIDFSNFALEHPNRDGLALGNGQ